MDNRRYSQNATEVLYNVILIALNGEIRSSEYRIKRTSSDVAVTIFGINRTFKLNSTERILQSATTTTTTSKQLSRQCYKKTASKKTRCNGYMKLLQPWNYIVRVQILIMFDICFIHTFDNSSIDSPITTDIIVSSH